MIDHLGSIKTTFNMKLHLVFTLMVTASDRAVNQQTSKHFLDHEETSTLIIKAFLWDVCVFLQNVVKTLQFHGPAPDLTVS